MDGEDKSLQLRVIEESDFEPTDAIRLDNCQTGQSCKPLPAIRLDNYETEQRRAKEQSEAEERPDLETVELRTHQPGIEALIDAELVSLDLLEQDWGEATVQRQPIQWGWFALIALLIAGAVLWSLTRVEKAEVEAIRIRTETATTIMEEEREEREASELIDRISNSVREFIGATSVESLVHLVRHSERVTPLMRQYYEEKPVDFGHFVSIRMLQPMTLDNRANFWMANVELDQGEIHSLVLEIGESGEPRVDWETFVCHQPMPWDDFVRQRPSGVSLDFRVYLEKDDFFNYEFSDAEHWVCFRLTAFGGGAAVFGYAKAEGEVARELNRQLERHGKERVSLLLRLTIPEGLQSRNGVVIEKLLSVRWLYLDPPDSGS